MKNILFLIGNGFDINLGLETKFSDVRIKYLEKDSDDLLIKAFKEVLKKDHENWSDFEKAMGLYTEKYGHSTKNDYLYQIESFRKILIEHFLTEEARINYDKDNHIFSIFKNSLINFGNYLPEKSKLALATIISPSPSSYEFQYDFISFNYTNILDKCLNIVKSKITNNYFRTHSQQYVKDFIGKILHVHGTLRENVILGVDNPGQIANLELSQDEEFLWKTVKTIMNDELDENYDLEARKMIDASSVICVFGMSLGETDKTWWEYILKWLSSSDTRHLVIFYYNENIDDTIPATKIINKHQVKNDFFNVAGCNNENQKGICENRIHIAKKNVDMFKMDILYKKGENTGKKEGKNIWEDNDLIVQTAEKLSGLDLQQVAQASKAFGELKNNSNT